MMERMEGKSNTYRQPLPFSLPFMNPSRAYYSINILPRKRSVKLLHKDFLENLSTWIQWTTREITSVNIYGMKSTRRGGGLQHSRVHIEIETVKAVLICLRGGGLKSRHACLMSRLSKSILEEFLSCAMPSKSNGQCCLLSGLYQSVEGGGLKLCPSKI